MTDFQLPSLVRELLLTSNRLFGLRSVSRDPFGAQTSSEETLFPAEALEKLEHALSNPATLEGQDLAQFVGALVLGVPGEVLLEESQPRASCGCCNYHDKEFLTVS